MCVFMCVPVNMCINACMCVAKNMCICICAGWMCSFAFVCMPMKVSVYMCVIYTQVPGCPKQCYIYQQTHLKVKQIREAPLLERAEKGRKAP